MAATLIVLDYQAVANTFQFGSSTVAANVTVKKGSGATSVIGLTLENSLQVNGSITVTGDLNITGKVNQTNVTNLDVKDYQVRVNFGGTTAGAAGAGLTVEGDTAATIAAIQYLGTSVTKWQVGNGSVMHDVVDDATAQTLTNKTLTSPVLTTPKVTVLNDNNGNQVLGFTATTSAVNYILLANSATGTNPSLNAAGSDANISLNLVAKGTGFVQINGVSVVDVSTTQTLTNKTLTTPKIAQINDPTNNIGVISIVGVASAVNNIQINNSISGSAPSVQAIGTDTNIDVNIVTKGTGQLKVNGVAVGTSATFHTTSLSGTVNGVNTAFTLGNALGAGSELITLNGQILTKGAGGDYTVSGTAVTFNIAPATGAVLQSFGTY